MAQFDTNICAYKNTHLLHITFETTLFWASLNLDNNYVSRITELVMNSEFKFVKNSSLHLSFGQAWAV